MRLRALALVLALTAAVFATAGVPKEWKDRYDTMIKAIVSLDITAFEAGFDASFVSIDDKGNKTDREAFFKLVEGILTDAQSVKASIKLKSFKQTGGTAEVGFDLHLTVVQKSGEEFVLHEVGTDYWSMSGGTWFQVKTVDKSLNYFQKK